MHSPRSHNRGPVGGDTYIRAESRAITGTFTAYIPPFKIPTEVKLRNVRMNSAPNPNVA